MTLYDKVLNLFDRYGVLTSERVTYLLAKDFETNKNLRTVQRYIAQLVKEGKLVPIVSEKRTQSYELVGKKTSEFSEFFLNKFWEELFRIRDELHKPRREFEDNWVNANMRLRSLVKMLPKEFKEKIASDLEKSGRISESQLNEMKERIDKERIKLLGEDESLNIEIDLLMESRIEELIDKISTMLHEGLKRDQTKT